MAADRVAETDHDGVSDTQKRNSTRSAWKRLEKLHETVEELGISPRQAEKWLRNAVRPGLYRRECGVAVRKPPPTVLLGDSTAETCTTGFVSVENKRYGSNPAYYGLRAFLLR